MSHCIAKWISVSGVRVRTGSQTQILPLRPFASNIIPARFGRFAVWNLARAERLAVHMTQKKLIKFYDDKLSALQALGTDKHMTLQELADEAFADLLKKHGRPVGIADALRQSAEIEKKKLR